MSQEGREQKDAKTTWYRSRLLFCAFISVVPMHCPHKKGHVRCHSCLYRFWSEIKV